MRVMEKSRFVKNIRDLFKVGAGFDFAKLAVIVGIILRLESYLEGRPLWVDECWSAIEVVNRSFSEILKNQYFFSVSSRPPMLFLLIEKISVFCFGNNEWALRLPPFLFSAASVIGFYLLGKKALPRRALLIAIWLFALSDPLVLYAAEAKRYSTSVFSIIFLATFVFDHLTSRFDCRRVLAFGLLGAVFLWLSYASFFMIAAVFIVLGIKTIRERRPKEVLCLAGSAAPVLLSCSLIYIFVVKEVLQSPEMTGYFSPGLWQGQLFSLAQAAWIGKVFLRSLHYPAGLLFPVLMTALILLGVWGFSRKSRSHAAVLALPIVLTLIAAGTGLYPFSGRVVLFLTPIYYFFISFGIDFTVRRYFRNNRWVLAVLLILVFLRPGQDLARYVFQTRTITENRDVLSFFSENYQPGDFVYSNQGARYPYYYYASSLGYGKALEKTNYYVALGDGEKRGFSRLGVFVDTIIPIAGLDLSPLVYEYLYFDERGMLRETFVHKNGMLRLVSPLNEARVLESGRNWLLLSLGDEEVFDETEERLNSIFSRRGELLLKYRAKGVGAYLYEIP